MQDNSGSAEGSVSGADYEEGALSNFLPVDIPDRPTDLELEDSGLQVAQVHHDTCMARHCSQTCCLQPAKLLYTMVPHH